jgi:hypothetical protein
MSKLYACIISNTDQRALIAIADRFSYSIETLEDGILFEVSGLERLIGKPEKIGSKDTLRIKAGGTAGQRWRCQDCGSCHSTCTSRNDTVRSLHLPDTFSQLQLDGLAIEEDTLNVFNDLGLHLVEDLLAIPEAELIDRYGS